MYAFTHVAFELNRYQQAERDTDRAILAQRRAHRRGQALLNHPSASPRSPESPGRIDALLGWADAELAGLMDLELPVEPASRELQSVGLR